MGNTKIAVDKHKPLIIFILRFLAALSVICGIAIYGMSIYTNYIPSIFLGGVYLASGLLSGTFLTALSYIVEYLYLIVMKLYFDVKNAKSD